MNSTAAPTPEEAPSRDRTWVYELLLVLVLLVGAYFRFIGLNWDEGQLLHPDERFLTQVETAIQPVGSVGEYFNTETSPLNPHNRGFGLFVYGTLPIFAVRYLGEWFGQVGYGEINLVGRALSAAADLALVFVVYLLAARAYDKRVGLLSAAFSASTVMLIQQAHFFTVDSVKTLFIVLAIYFAVRVATARRAPPEEDAEAHEEKGAEGSPQRFTSNSQFNVLTFVLFGISLGMAAASKVDAGIVAVMLPAAVLLRLFNMEKERRSAEWINASTYLMLAAIVSLLVFRLLQPYAFSGPGFFGISPGDRWVANMQEIVRQAAGDIDWPPSIQWARRPVWFSFENMVLWGMGLPMGIAAWTGFLWAGWRILRGEWRKHILLWGWTAAFFTWQSLKFNPTMRYQLPIYPTLAVFAGWGIVALWDKAKQPGARQIIRRAARPLALTLGGLALVGTLAWAFAFTRIYTVSDARVHASRWIYQNIPGPITLPIGTGNGGGTYNQPLPFPYDQSITSESPYLTSFTPRASGTISEIRLKYVLTPLQVTIYDPGLPGQPVANLSKVFDFSQVEGENLRSVTFNPNQTALTPDVEYRLKFKLPPGEGSVLLQELTLQILHTEGEEDNLIPLLADAPRRVEGGEVFQTNFTVPVESLLDEIYISFTGSESFEPARQSLYVALGENPDIVPPLATAEQEVSVSSDSGAMADGPSLTLSKPVSLIEGQTYYLRIEVKEEDSALTLLGAAAANETPWDMGLPLRIDGYDGYSGIYQRGLELGMYRDDNPEKLLHFLDVLDNTEYVFISSSRQWGSLPRIPERFPLSIAYYRHLLGCPEEKTIEWCYNAAEKDTFQGELGFELVQVFQTHPQIGSWQINDQPSEEAFTVYDHAKVFIFRKTPAFEREKVAELLGAVDLTQVVRLTPKRASRQTSDLMLPESRFARQRQSGTWADLFNTGALFNRYPALSAVLWYLALSLLGLAAYPLLRVALSGLADHGFPLIRVAGLLLLAYPSWLAGSLGLPFSRLTIAGVFFILLLGGGYLAYRKREELQAEWRSKRRYFLIVEGLFLALFVVGLLIRLGNPDLWHPRFGGEKPMDFSYFNAVLKSTAFPPYDPWYAGGYINYYYYGFVYAGTLVKLLGIVPSVAYNLILPTLFATIALGAFSIGWNLFAHWRMRIGEDDGSSISKWLVGGAAGLGMAVLGNLGTISMIFRGYQQLGAQGLYNEEAFFLTKAVWAVRGFVETLKGNSLPFGLGDWYWNPSRVIPENAITEFPMFTFIYGDLHAHLIALPLTLLALAWGLSVLFGRAWQAERGEKRRGLKVGWSVLFGALAIGALRPTNTWDFPTFLAFGAAALTYAVWRYYQPVKNKLEKWLEPNMMKAGIILLSIGLLTALSLFLFQPYSRWYVQGYTRPELWTASHTPLSAYLTHWGVFLFVLVSWLAWETRQWMASTPLSSLRKLEPYRGWIIAVLILLLVWVLALQFYQEVHVAFLVAPLAAWASVLLLRPGLPDAKRAVLFMVGTGLFLSLMVEVVRVQGDIGRMNTVFKFYLQTWTLFAVSAAAALGWTLSELRLWLPSWRGAWQIALTALVGSAALFPLLGTAAKVADRMAPDAPHTLDGMTYMDYAEYGTYGGVTLDLSVDYRAIHWMQKNVEGSPVIVEANNPQYLWGSRFSIYTGLPGVVGWEWHQRQQREYVPGNNVVGRVAEVGMFYETTDAEFAESFLQKYDVRYIVFGGLERATYPGPGLDKFEQLEGQLWRAVYRDGNMVIYEVLPEVLSPE